MNIAIPGDGGTRPTSAKRVRYAALIVTLIAGVLPGPEPQGFAQPPDDGEPATYTWPSIEVPGWKPFRPKATGPDRWEPGGRTPARWYAMMHSAEVIVPGRSFTREASVSITVERYSSIAEAVTASRRIVRDETRGTLAPESVPDLRGGGTGASAKLDVQNPARNIRVLDDVLLGTAWLRVDLPLDGGPPEQVTDMRLVAVDAEFVASIRTWFPDGQPYEPELLQQQLQALMDATAAGIAWWRGATPVELPDDMRVTLRHIQPTFDRDVDGGGGKLIVTVVDKEGEPVAGADVAVFVESGSDLDGVLRMGSTITLPVAAPALISGIIDRMREFYWFANPSNYWLARTNHEGRAVLHYVNYGFVHFDRRSGAAGVLHAKGAVQGQLHAVVFEKMFANVPLEKVSLTISDHMILSMEFDSVARLASIETTKRGGERKVRCMRIDPRTNEVIRGSRQILASELPATRDQFGVPLIPGDMILLDQDDLIRIHWVDGSKMTVAVVPGALKSTSGGDAAAPFARFVILDGDPTYAERMRTLVRHPLQAFAVGGGGSLVISAVSANAGAVFTTAYMFFVGGFELGESLRNPLVITPHSQFLLRLTEEGSRVLTLEGEVEVWELATGQSRRVEEKHYLPISSTGALGPVGSFDPQRLAEDLIPVAAAMQSSEKVRGESTAGEQPRREDDKVPATAASDSMSAMELGRQALELYSRKQYDEAIALFDRAIQKKPDFSGAWNCRGLCYRRLGQLDRALADLDQSIALAPRFAAAYSNRGNVYQDLGRSREAIADWTRAIELDAEQTHSWFNRGNEYIRQGEYDAGLADLEQAIRLDPRNGKYHHRRAFALWKKGALREALQSVEKAVECGRRTKELRTLRNDIYKSLAETDL